MHDTEQIQLIATCITANVTNRKPKERVAVKQVIPTVRWKIQNVLYMITLLIN